MGKHIPHWQRPSEADKAPENEIALKWFQDTFKEDGYMATVKDHGNNDGVTLTVMFEINEYRDKLVDHFRFLNGEIYVKRSRGKKLVGNYKN